MFTAEDHSKRNHTRTRRADHQLHQTNGPPTTTRRADYRREAMLKDHRLPLNTARQADHQWEVTLKDPQLPRLSPDTGLPDDRREEMPEELEGSWIDWKLEETDRRPANTNISRVLESSGSSRRIYIYKVYNFLKIVYYLIKIFLSYIYILT